MELYNRLNLFLKQKLGKRTLKICVDGGFTCPNRDGSKSINGCIFCSNRGSGEKILKQSIKDQVRAYLNSYKAKRANQYILYFQNYSSSYAPINILKERYDEGLNASDKIVALDIATRCDCINEEFASLLNEYQKKYYVYVELGLQTSNFKTHEILNTKYSKDEFLNAINILNKHHIDVVIHLMVGLPNETIEDIKNTINFINNINYQGLKIHSTYVIKNTFLDKLYNDGKYQLLDYEYYLNAVIYILTHIKKDVVIHRLNGDPLLEDLVGPEWCMHKKRVIIDIEKRLKENNLYQGIYYGKD